MKYLFLKWDIGVTMYIQYNIHCISHYLSGPCPNVHSFTRVLSCYVVYVFNICVFFVCAMCVCVFNVCALYVCAMYVMYVLRMCVLCVSVYVFECICIVCVYLLVRISQNPI